LSCIIAIMNSDELKTRGVVLFDLPTFEAIHKSLYHQVLSHLLEDDVDFSKAEEFILSFYSIFEHSKKLILFEAEQ